MNANAGGNADKYGLENDITIRKWEEKDCFAVSEIEKLCFPDPWTEEMVLGSFSDDYFHGYVAENRGKVIAYVGLSIVFDTADIIDTYAYRLFMDEHDYPLSSAVGIFKTSVNFILLLAGNFITKKINGYSMFSID